MEPTKTSILLPLHFPLGNCSTSGFSSIRMQPEPDPCSPITTLLDFLWHLPTSPQPFIPPLCACSASGPGMLNIARRNRVTVHIYVTTSMCSDLPGSVLLLGIASTRSWVAHSLGLCESIPHLYHAPQIPPPASSPSPGLRLPRAPSLSAFSYLWTHLR